MKKLKKDGAPRMAITTDFYDEEVYEGIKNLAILAKMRKGEYVRNVLTNHFKRKRRRLAGKTKRESKWS